MKYILFIVLLVAVLVTAGCTGENQTSAVTPTPQIVYVTVLVTPTPQITTETPETTALPTPDTSAERKITDGYWCRDTTMNIGTASTKITECYRFFSDGTYKWGYSPGWPMGKSLSCSGDPSEKCTYILNGRGQYEVEGGYMYTLTGDSLIDAHDPPYFLWSAGGIP
ncbi:MAG: hypothetical protein CVV30_03635 [Methanomicrobiales archaeon HGW-Methanomicrobiales-1]|jgi:hypothetical protein|nr:MAG: hypothetical protein CVV30_03635 [Methanomicrobiales archaeon HGW-Methanomicrobiales-1]